MKGGAYLKEGTKSNHYSNYTIFQYISFLTLTIIQQYINFPNFLKNYHIFFSGNSDLSQGAATVYITGVDQG